MKQEKLGKSGPRRAGFHTPRRLVGLLALAAAGVAVGLMPLLLFPAGPASRNASGEADLVRLYEAGM